MCDDRDSNHLVETCMSSWYTRLLNQHRCPNTFIDEDPWVRWLMIFCSPEHFETFRTTGRPSGSLRYVGLLT